MKAFFIMSYVCNLAFNLLGTYGVPATGSSVADGQIYASGFDAGMTVKYNLNADFTYDTGGQTSGHFTSLVPGTYVVYARSNSFCRKTITIKVEWVRTWSPLYRLQWFDNRGDSQFKYRFDIEDSEFHGEVTELEQFGDEPVEMSWRGESNQDIWTGVVSSECRVKLLATEDQQFIGLWTANDRRYRGKLYLWNIDDELWELKWCGFMTPQLYSEPYLQKRNYYNTFVFTDQLSNLSRIQFSDDGGSIPTQRISVMQVIYYCLRKTDISLQVWDTFNISADGMLDDDDDNRLEQLFVDPGVYVDTNDGIADCLTILKSELTNLGCRLMQADGHWQIDHIPYKAGASVLTRSYAFLGGSIDTFSKAYRVMLRRSIADPPKVVFANRDAQMNISPLYGKINIDVELSTQKNNLLVQGEFQDVDIANGQLEGWGIADELLNPYTAGNTSDEYKWSIEKDDDRGDGFTMFQVAFKTFDIELGIIPTRIPERYTILSSQKVRITEPLTDYKLRLSFDVKAAIESTLQVIPSTSQYVYFDYSLSFEDGDGQMYYVAKVTGTGFLLAQASTIDSNLLEGEWIRNYIDDANQWKKIDAEITVSALIDYPVDMQLRIRISRNPFYELGQVVQGTGDLGDVVTAGLDGTPTRTINNRRRVRQVLSEGTHIWTFFLEGGEEDPDDVNVVAPDDNDVYRWRKKNDMYDQENIQAWCSRFNVRNVVIQYLPEGQEPDHLISTSIVIDPDNKLEQSITLKHADLQSNSNYRNISKYWYSLGDGTPTSLWRTPDGTGPSKSFIDSFKDWYQGQNVSPRWRLTGTLDHNGVLPSLANTIYEVRTGRIYLPMEMTLRLRSRLLTCEMIEILKGQAVVDEGDPDPDVEPPVDIGEHTTEFTTEFS